ncbi:MAG: spore gernimation protein GerQ [Bacillales bacterium]|jgi:spore germination protein Q|nr:spore gernimation protein GerQ [Bacillales bacterium]
MYQQYGDYRQNVPQGFLQPSGSYLPPQVPQQVQPVPFVLPREESYIENILRLNKGKVATVYMTFENSKEWPSKIFKGVIEAAGRDHIILSDQTTGMRYVLLMVYLDFITFDNEINYYYPIGNEIVTNIQDPVLLNTLKGAQ